jgi:hypothetical protein
MTWTGGKKKINDNPLAYSYYYFCGRKNNKKNPVVCSTVPISAEKIEEYVINFVKDLLNDPKAVYEYQKQLISSKLQTQHLEATKSQFIKLFNTLPQTRENLRLQHEIGEIDATTYIDKLNELKKQEKEYPQKISELDYQLSKIALSKGYEASFEAYSKKYISALENKSEDKEELYQLIHMLIYQIVVYSRPRTASDVIAGVKKFDQFIPDRIDIHFNLPQKLLQQLYIHEFGVRNDNLYSRRDSNPQPSGSEPDTLSG